jgi:hypothetical protein
MPELTAAACKSIRDFESLLRACGFSNRQAKALAAGGWRALRPDDDVDADQSSELATRLDAAIAELKGK